MKFVIKISLLLRMILSLMQVQAQPLLLHFQPEIEAEAKTLGDLVLIGNDQQGWVKTSLDSSPRAGERLSEKQVLLWMCEHFGPFAYQWRGPRYARVRQKKQTSKKALLAKAEKALFARLSKTYSRLELRPLTAIEDSPYPLESFHTRMQLIYPVGKRSCVWLVNEHKTIPVWFAVKAYQKVPIAKHKLSAHSLVSTKDFLWQERNIAGLKTKPADAFSETKWLNKRLQAKSILLADHLSAPPEIRRGQEVQVRIYKHEVLIAIEALALDEGYLGQEIRLQNPANQKHFSARVSGKQQAEIRA